MVLKELEWFGRDGENEIDEKRDKMARNKLNFE
jgi:hypothetical protein